MATKVSATASTEDIRRAYYETAGYSLWITEFQLDPLQLVVCDDSTGKFFRVGVNLTSDGATFDDAVEVAVEYRDVPAGKAAAQAGIAWASRDVSRQGMPEPTTKPAPKITPAQAAQRIHQAPVAGQANGPTKSKEGSTMDPAVLREALGLSTEAPDDEVRAALAAAGFPPAAPASTEPTTAPQPNSDTVLPPAVPSAASAGSDAIILDPVQYSALRVAAARGEEAWRKMREAECTGVLDAAIKAGKFPPARRDHYERLWAADPDGTKVMVESLAANVIPILSSGYPGVGDETEQDMAYAAMYPDTRKVGGGRG